MYPGRMTIERAVIKRQRQMIDNAYGSGGSDCISIKRADGSRPSDILGEVLVTLLRIFGRYLYICLFFAATSNFNRVDSFLTPAEPHEYCQWENFNASCPGHDEVVLMQSARYGRIRFGRCMREDHGSVGCSADVLFQLDRKCSGRRSCHMQIPDASLHGIHPCPKELMPYLEASYQCVKVHGVVPVNSHHHGSSSTTPTTRCDPTVGFQIRAESGFLAGITAAEWPRVGTPDCPWVLRAAPGRRFNLTLYSFVSAATATVAATSGIAASHPSGTNFQPSATASQSEDPVVGYTGSGCSLSSGGLIIFDGNRTSAFPVCNPSAAHQTGSIEASQREQRIYTSDGPTVRMFVQTFTELGAPTPVIKQQQQQQPLPIASAKLVGGRGTNGFGPSSSPAHGSSLGSSPTFLIRFQAFGCADMIGVPNAQVRRSGDSVSVRCLATGETYFLTCIDSRWVGELHNCTSLARGGRLTMRSASGFPYGILLVIGLGVAIGVALGVVLLFGLLLCFRSRRHRRCLKSGLLYTDQPLLMSLNGPGSANCINTRLEATAEDRLIELPVPPQPSCSAGDLVDGNRDANISERYYISRRGPWMSSTKRAAANNSSLRRTALSSFEPEGLQADDTVSASATDSTSYRTQTQRRLCPYHHHLIQTSSSSLIDSPVSSISGRRRNLSGAAVSDDVISASDYLQFRWPEGVEVGQFASAAVLDSGAETLVYERSAATLDLIKDSSTFATEPEAASSENGGGGIDYSSNGDPAATFDAEQQSHSRTVNLQTDGMSTTVSHRNSEKSNGDRAPTVTNVSSGHIAC